MVNSFTKPPKNKWLIALLIAIVIECTTGLFFNYIFATIATSFARPILISAGISAYDSIFRLGFILLQWLIEFGVNIFLLVKAIQFKKTQKNVN